MGKYYPAFPAEENRGKSEGSDIDSMNIYYRSEVGIHHVTYTEEVWVVYEGRICPATVDESQDPEYYRVTSLSGNSCVGVLHRSLCFPTPEEAESSMK